MLDFTISQQVAKRYPGTKVGIIEARGLITKESDAWLEELKVKTFHEFRELHNFRTLLESVGVASWRKFYRSMGLDPRKNVPPHEGLGKRVLKRRQLPQILTLVDCANLAALKFLTPVGAFDLNKLVGQITLRLAKDGEAFVPLGSEGPEDLTPGEVVYADAEKVFSRYSKDSNYTRITPHTENAFIVVDGTREIDERYIREAVSYLADLIRKVCGGTFAQYFFEAR